MRRRPSYVGGRPGRARSTQAQVDAAVAEALAPFERESGESPYDIQRDLQEMMQANVGIIRTAAELDEAIVAARRASPSACANVAVKGGRAYNPGWNLATDLPSMLTVSRVHDARGDRAQREPRRPHPRGLPRAPTPSSATVNFAHSPADGGGYRRRDHDRALDPLLTMPDELQGPARGGARDGRRDDAGLARRRHRRRLRGLHARRRSRARSCSTSSTASRRPRRPTSRAGGTARRASAESCSAEVNGKPRLMCMTRMDQLPDGPVTVTPMRTFPIIRDLVTDVSFNYEMAKRVPALQPPPEPEGGYRMQQVTSSAARSSASASSASCARTSAT